MTYTIYGVFNILHVIILQKSSNCNNDNQKMRAREQRWWQLTRFESKMNENECCTIENIQAHCSLHNAGCDWVKVANVRKDTWETAIKQAKMLNCVYKSPHVSHIIHWCIWGVYQLLMLSNYTRLFHSECSTFALASISFRFFFVSSSISFQSPSCIGGSYVWLFGSLFASNNIHIASHTKELYKTNILLSIHCSIDQYEEQIWKFLNCWATCTKIWELHINMLRNKISK